MTDLTSTTPPSPSRPASESSPPSQRPSPTRSRRHRVLTLGAGLLLLCGFVVAVTRPPGLTEPLQAAVESSGIAAPVVFVLLCVLSVPLHLNPVVVVLSPLLFPLPVAAALSVTGSLVGCLLTVGALRRTGAAPVGQGEGWPGWLTGLARRVSRRPVVVGVLVRLVLNTGLAVEAFFLLTGYRRRTYLVVTVVGVTLWVAQTVLGVTALHALTQVSPWLGLAAFAVPVLSIGVPLYLRRRRAARAT